MNNSSNSKWYTCKTRCTSGTISLTPRKDARHVAPCTPEAAGAASVAGGSSVVSLGSSSRGSHRLARTSRSIKTGKEYATPLADSSHAICEGIEGNQAVPRSLESSSADKLLAESPARDASQNAGVSRVSSHRHDLAVCPGPGLAVAPREEDRGAPGCRGGPRFAASLVLNRR